MTTVSRVCLRVVRDLVRVTGLVLVLSLCVACPSPRPRSSPGNGGGGGGGGGGQPTSSALYFDAPAVVEAGAAFVGRVRATSASEATQFALAQAPAGMSIDPATGEVAWTPTVDRRGANPIAITANVRGTEERVQAVVFVEVFETVARQRIAAASGGVVQVRDSATPAAGTAITFPAGALEGDTEVVVRVNTAPSLFLTSFFVLDLGPSQRFRTPVRLELGYTDEWLARAGVANEAGLRIVYRNPETGAWEPVPSMPDPSGNRVVAQIEHFSTYALIVDGLEDLTNAARGALQALRDALAALLGGAVDGVQGLINAIQCTAQPRRLVVVQGGAGVRNSDRIALLIHGIFSSSANFPQLKSHARENYDHVYFYEYPTDVAIRSNAAALAAMVLQDAGKFPDGCSVDVYVHSMGGLVFRSALEDSKAAMLMSGVHWNHVVFLGTPHRGGDLRRIQILQDLLPYWRYVSQGLTDLRPGSAFLEALTLPPGQGWTKYSAIGGMSLADSTTDGFVHLDSALPAGEFRYADNHRVVATHSELHTHMFNNGVSVKLDAWRAPQHQGPDGGRQPVGVTTRVTRGPVREGRYAWVQATATVTFGAWVPLPPFASVQTLWRGAAFELSDYRWLFDDPSDYPFLSFTPGLIETLEAQGKLARGRTAQRTLSFSAREEDVPVEVGALALTVEVVHVLSRAPGGEPFKVVYGPY